MLGVSGEIEQTACGLGDQLVVQPGRPRPSQTEGAHTDVDQGRRLGAGIEVPDRAPVVDQHVGGVRQLVQ